MTTTIKAELLEMRVSSIAVDPFTNSPIVILKGVIDNNTALPIWIGILEASAIAAQMEDVKFSRPMTHDLIRKLMVNTGATVNRIEINDLRDNVYYASIHMKDCNGESHIVDSRPSDAIAVALRMNASIFVARGVIDRSKDLEKAPSIEDSLMKDSEGLLEMLEEMSPEAFGKYKM
jgi:hypothetical protein